MRATDERVNDGQICLPAPSEDDRKLEVELSFVGFAADDDQGRMHRIGDFR